MNNNDLKPVSKLVLVLWLTDKHIILNSAERYNRFYELADREKFNIDKESASSKLFKILSQVMRDS